MGVPAEATATTAGAFSGFSIVIETKWGVTPLLFQTKYFSKDLCLTLNKPNLRNPPLSIRIVSKAFYDPWT